MHTARLFKNGGSQSVRLPKEFRLPGKKVRIHREGQRIVLEPLDAGMASLIDSLGRFSDDYFQEGRMQPPMQKREKL